MDDNEHLPENEVPSSEPNEIAALRAEAADMKDRMLRALADAENTRRRAEREKQDASQYAVTKFARDMLQIADNFARALAACPPAVREAADPQVKAVIDGVEATERQLLSVLERYGVKAIDTTDGKFDPNFHQAIAEVPGNGKPAGSIVDVVQAGYTIGERLLRPAMVTVARRDDGSSGGGGNGIDTRA
jgi:molecular chaperone GrpE